MNFHKNISYIKSLIRLLGIIIAISILNITIYFSLLFLLICLGIAEILGIIEEK